LQGGPQPFNALFSIANRFRIDSTFGKQLKQPQGKFRLAEMFGFHGSSHDGIDIALSCFTSQEPQACHFVQNGPTKKSNNGHEDREEWKEEHLPQGKTGLSEHDSDGDAH
jgi:hypothetical protein